MKSKPSTGYLAGLTLLITLAFLVFWEFWLEGFILIDLLDMEVNKNSMDRWTFVITCISIVCLSLIIPFKQMKSTMDNMKSLETALHGEQTLSKVFFTVDNSLILVIDTSNQVMQINQKTTALLGYTEDDILGRDWINLLVPEKSRENVRTQHKRLQEDKRQSLVRFTAPVKTKGGNEKMIDWQCSVLTDERGQKYGIINSGQDISEQLRLKNELTQAKSRYEPQIKKLTADLDANKKKFHNEAIKSANATARFRFWFDLEKTLMDLTPETLKNPYEVNKRIKKALQLFGQMSGVDQGYVFQFRSNGKSMINSHLWVAEEPLMEPEADEEISTDNFPWFTKMIHKKEIIHVPKVSEMPREAAAEKEVYNSQGIKSFINAPMVRGNTSIGYIGFESNQKERGWDADEINVLKVISRLITSILNPAAASIPAKAEDTPEITLEEPSGPTQPVQKGKTEASQSLEKELKKARAEFEKELKEKIKEAQSAHVKLKEELQERKQAESELRKNRDAIERQLAEKSIELEKLLAGKENSPGTTPEINLKKPEQGAKPEEADHQKKPASKTDMDPLKENEIIREALQKKEAELAILKSQLKSQSGSLMASEVKDFKTKIQSKDNELNSLRQGFEEEKSRRSQAEKELNKIQTSMDQQKEKIETLEAANATIEAELEELKTIHEELKDSGEKLEDTQQELESLEIANEQLMTDVEDKNYIIEETKEKAARYEQMDIPLFTLDENGIIISWNRMAASTTGFIPELALDQSIAFIFPESDEFDFEENFMKPLRENQKLRLETPIKKANQKTFKALVSLASFKDRNGIVTTLGYFVNLSDADKEAELKEIQSRFNALLGNSGLILVNLSPDFLITDLNEQALKTFNWEKENVTQRNFFEVILPGDEWKKTLEETRNRLSEENTSELENQSVLSDKTQHTFSWSLAKETDPKDETIKGYIAIAKDITEFKEAQNSLKENEVLLNSIVDKSNDAFIAIDENGIIQSFNTGAEHLFGYSSDEILGQNVSNLMPEPYSKEHDNYLSRFLETGRSKLVGGPPREFVGKRKNGSIFPFEITVREMYKGYQRLFVGIGQDISKRKALEVALNENREKFRRFMEAESNAVIIIDSVSQQIIEHNDAALQMYGYESDDLLNLTFQNLLAKPDSSEEGAESSTSPGLGSVNKTALLYQKKKDGTVFPSHITTNSFLVQDQNMELKIIRDTSSQVRLEENFKEAEGHLRNVLNSVDSAIFLKDRSGKFTLVNAAFERLFNKTNEEIKGKTAEEVFPGEYLEALFSGDSSVYEAASPLEGKHNIHHSDGIHIYHFIKFSLRNTSGIPYGLCGVLKNTTQVHRLEDEIFNLRENLENMVDRRVQHIKDDQTRIVRSEKLKTAETLATTIADQINNPIYGIQNILDQVKQRSNLEDIHKGLITVALNECQRVADLISKLKSYQPLSSENMEPLDINQLLDDVLAENNQTFNEQKISLEKHFTPDLPQIDGIPNQIRLALQNILQNAEEAFNHGNGKIYIATEKNGSHIKIHIKDTGCGIPPENLDHIFDPFFTTKSALHRPGLGLLSAWSIVKNHKGEIDVHSHPGRGTTFTLTFPLKQ